MTYFYISAGDLPGAPLCLVTPISAGRGWLLTRCQDHAYARILEVAGV